ncbi:GTPase activity protein [Coemansia sp. RSA 1086]|nr:GTPase activity protein [Coemansia sp. RSA 1086]
MDSKIFKIVMVGKARSGKTSLRNYFLYRNYTWQYTPTKTPDFVSTNIVLDNRVQVAMQIWDTAGSSTSTLTTDSLAQVADGIVLVYDGKEQSAQQARYMAQNIAERVPKVVVRSKCDIAGETEDMGGLVQVNASARTGENVDHVFQTIAQLCLQRWREQSEVALNRLSKHGDPISYHTFDFEDAPLKRKSLRAAICRLFCLA